MRPPKWKVSCTAFGATTISGPPKIAGEKSGVDRVVADDPAAADDAADRIVEPGAAAPDLDLLLAREPEAPVDETVLDDDEQVLERVVDERGAREVERHPDDLRVVAIDVHGADDARLAIVLRPHLDLVGRDGAPGEVERAASRVMAKSYAAEPDRRERMRDVAHLVALAEPDDGREVVLDDAEVIAVVRDVRREEERVPPAEDALLAEVGRAPIDFVHELVGFHDLGRLGESLADLGEEGDVAVRDGLVVPEAGVGELLGASRGGPLDEGTRARVVPLLGARRARRERDNPTTRGERRDEQAMHSRKVAGTRMPDKHARDDHARHTRAPSVRAR